jgi:hypothetical protein
VGKEGKQMILGFSEKLPSGKPSHFPEKILLGIKKSTIRKKFRWKVGDKIHFATGVRIKKYKQFATGIVTKVYHIIIEPKSRIRILKKGSQINIYPNTDLMNLFVRGEGFDSEDDFWEWFTDSMEGQLIYWELDK